MIAPFFILLSLILPNVYAQDEQKYNPGPDILNYFIFTLLPLLVFFAYNSIGDAKKYISLIETGILILLLLIFPPIYNYFIYESTSTFGYTFMVLSLVSIIIVLCEKEKFKPQSFIAMVFPFGIYWFRIGDISEKIGYKWTIVVTSIFILIVFMLFLIRRPALGIFFLLGSFSRSDFFFKLFEWP
jgi:hypothetical protein